MRSKDEAVFCFGLHHMDMDKEIVILKMTGGNFYAFPPYAKKPMGCIDVHMSLHASGERHFTVRVNGNQGKEEKRIREESRVQLCPPDILMDVIPLYNSSIFLGLFAQGLPVGTNPGQIILLDAKGANFRDDYIIIRVYAVAPGAEYLIPTFPDTGPRILHLVKQTRPWLAVDVYQQALPQQLF